MMRSIVKLVLEPMEKFTTSALPNNSLGRCYNPEGQEGFLAGSAFAIIVTQKDALAEHVSGTDSC